MSGCNRLYIPISIRCDIMTMDGIDGCRGSDLDLRIREYWEERARGYSLATRISLNDEKDMFRTTLEDVLRENRRLDVADMGTGAGYAAIAAGMMGHHVVGIDNSECMIQCARRNAHDFGVDVEFILGDINSPGYTVRSFDAVIAKDVIWSLIDPVSAYMEWTMLLKPGGTLIVADGNYYLDLYDDEYRRKTQYNIMKSGKDNNLHAKTNMDNVDFNRIKELAMELPLSRIRRPSWDVSVLLGLGYEDIRVISMDKTTFSTLTEDGPMILPSKFMVVARMPTDSDVQENSRTVADSEMIDAISQRLDRIDEGMLSVLKSLSDGNRLKIALGLIGGGMTVSQISVAIGISPSHVSHNLKVMRDGGIVESHREGKEVIYTLRHRYAMEALLGLAGSISDGTSG